MEAPCDCHPEVSRADSVPSPGLGRPCGGPLSPQGQSTRARPMHFPDSRCPAVGRRGSTPQPRPGRAAGGRCRCVWHLAGFLSPCVPEQPSQHTLGCFYIFFSLIDSKILQELPSKVRHDDLGNSVYFSFLRLLNTCLCTYREQFRVRALGILTRRRG